MEMSPTIGQLADALSKAQGAMSGAVKDASNPFFKSKYADLASVWDACRGPLSTHGLSIVQSPSADGAKVSVETFILHASGEWMRGSVTAEAKDASPQAVGSTVTYLRRYALQSIAGVAPEDDDAESAQPRQMAPVGQPRKTYPGDGEETLLTIEQRDTLAKAAGKADRGTDEIRAYLKRHFGIEGSKDIKLKDYRTILAAIAKPGELL